MRALTEGTPSLADLAAAPGAAVVSGGTCATVGETPSADEILALFARRPGDLRKVWLLESRIPRLKAVLAHCVQHRIGFDDGAAAERRGPGTLLR